VAHLAWAQGLTSRGPGVKNEDLPPYFQKKRLFIEREELDLKKL